MRSTLPPLVFLLVTSACHFTSKDVNDHWNLKSVAPSIARFALGADPESYESYRDFAWARKQEINLTLRRHLFHVNPNNPNHPEWPGRYEPRPTNSLLPNPLYYVHLGPNVIDSIIGTFDAEGNGQIGGRDEFMDGVSEAFGGTIGVITSTFAHKWIGPHLGGVVTRVERLWCGAATTHSP